MGPRERRKEREREKREKEKRKGKREKEKKKGKEKKGKEKRKRKKEKKKRKRKKGKEKRKRKKEKKKGKEKRKRKKEKKKGKERNREKWDEKEKRGKRGRQEKKRKRTSIGNLVRRMCPRYKDLPLNFCVYSINLVGFSIFNHRKNESKKICEVQKRLPFEQNPNTQTFTIVGWVKKKGRGRDCQEDPEMRSNPHAS